MKQRRAFLALGSNLGDRVAHLRLAVDNCPDIVRWSPVYETEPVGGPDNQGPYLNMTVELLTDRSGRELLEVCRMLEKKADRLRRVHWGPRTLDVDVLWIDGETVDDDDLAVPHRRMFERPFVLAPLSHLAPDIAVPGWEQAFAHLGVWIAGDLHSL